MAEYYSLLSSVVLKLISFASDVGDFVMQIVCKRANASSIVSHITTTFLNRF